MHVHGSALPDHCHGNPSEAMPPPRLYSPYHLTSTFISVAALYRCPRAAPLTSCTSLSTPRAPPGRRTPPSDRVLTRQLSSWPRASPGRTPPSGGTPPGISRLAAGYRLRQLLASRRLRDICARRIARHIMHHRHVDLRRRRGGPPRRCCNTVDLRRRRGEEKGSSEVVCPGADPHGATPPVDEQAWSSPSLATAPHPAAAHAGPVLAHQAQPRARAHGGGRLPVVLELVRPHYVYSTPSLEHPGMIKINYHGGPPCDPDGHGLVSGGVDAVERVARWIDEFMPGRVETASGPVERVPCMYSMTPDEDFVIDFLGDFGQDMVIGAGFSGHEFKMGPAVGSILAEMAMDGEARTVAEAGVELGHLRINRFDGNPMGNAKDL
ncbi:hypothetical protein SETIT_5G020800v2 [Setaria italica]|uniref:FAD dependent oxidoreductase domain-containing protein n=1 Tax=Setaria italica TaxID=4555 RepID=K3XR60_SETIT|nr:hypothetical protein SETIT_5G020800v2 [Setaria italica]